MLERRNSARVHHIGLASDLRGGRPRIFPVTNISETGIGLRAKTEAIRSRELLLSFCLEGSGIWVRAVGRIVRTEPEGLIGVRFTMLDESARNVIKAFIRKSQELPALTLVARS